MALSVAAVVEVATFSALCDGFAALKRLSRESAGTVDDLPVVVGAPRSGVDVDMIRIEAQRLGLNAVVDFPVQHTNA